MSLDSYLNKALCVEPPEAPTNARHIKRNHEVKDHRERVCDIMRVVSKKLSVFFE